MAFCVMLCAAPQVASAQTQYGTGQVSSGANLQAEAEQLLAFANRARRIAGAQQLQWDSSLAQAAFYHCQWMVQQGPISHRYSGEPDLTARASDAGARFGVIEENVAIGNTAQVIHDAWMQSPGHRKNLLNPDMDRVGIAVIASRGVLYAVADYTHGVPRLTAEDVESRVADLIRVSGIAIATDPTTARETCAMNSGFARNSAGRDPRFVDRWVDASLDKLPEALIAKLSSGDYREAAIGSCPAGKVQGGFTAYRVAVLLY
jgi:hypothetical protein